MNLVKKLFNKLRKKKYQPIVLCKDLTKLMIEKRIMIVPNYKDEKGYDPKISMFH